MEEFEEGINRTFETDEINEIRNTSLQNAMEELFDFSFLHTEENNTVPVLLSNFNETEFNIGGNTSNININNIADQYF